MEKLTTQALITIALFFAMWFALSNINWITILKVQQTSKTIEEKLGDLFWDVISESEKEIEDSSITAPLDSILSKICISNDIDRNLIKLHIVKSEEINAFVLPNKHLVIYSSLISVTENEAELCGVICHELAHVEMNHIMKKMIKEIGLSVLISMTTGNSSSNEIVKETVKLLSSSAFDKNLEKEADLKAVDFLIKSKINPEHFANFLYKIADDESRLEKYLSWINTHPDSKERAEYIIIHSNGTVFKDTKPILAQSTWNKLKMNF